MKHKKAKMLAALAAQSPLLLFAGQKPTTASVQTATYNVHECLACSTEVAFGAPVDGVKPFCPACSCTMTPVERVVEVQPQEELLTSINCPTCQNHNVVEDRFAEALAGKMHCTACGTQIAYLAPVASVDEEDEDESEDGTDEVVADAEVSDQHAEDSDGDNNGVGGDAEEREAGRDSTTETADADDAADAASAVADGAAEAAKRAAGEEEDLGDAFAESASDDDMIDVELTDVVDEDGDVEVKLDEDGESARLLAFVGGVHAMTLEEEDAGDNAEVMVQASFHTALQRESARSGFMALANYGFKPVVIRVPLGRQVEKRVQAALAGDKAKVEARLGDLKADFNQCLQIASAALIQNFYRNRPNPIATKLIASLEGMGVKQAKKIVTAAISAAGPQFAAALLELSEELMDKSVDTRNELSDTLTQMNPATASDELEEEEDEDEGAPLEEASIRERLIAGVHSVKPVRSRAVTASVDGNLAGQLRALKNL